MNTPRFSIENQFNSSMYHQENRLIIQSPSVESKWTIHDHSLFLNAFVSLPDDIAGRWEKIADAVPGKTAAEVKAHYDGLEHELSEIEAGRVELPNYPDDYVVEESSGEFKKGGGSVVSSDSELGASQISFGVGMGSNSTRGEKERKRGNPWSVEEHRRFLEGLKRYGKGDWRMISRNVVVTRTPSQVASHAQKYFIRQKSEKKERKRSSIHDITTTDTTMVVHAQSTPSRPPTPPSTSVYGGQGRGVHSRLPPQSISFYGGEGRGAQSPLTPQSSGFYGAQSSLTPPATNFYDGEGSGAELALTPIPISFCAGEGALPPTNFYGEGQVGALTPLMTNFYGGAPPPLTGNGFQQNFIYHPFF